MSLSEGYIPFDHVRIKHILEGQEIINQKRADMDRAISMLGGFIGSHIDTNGCPADCDAFFRATSSGSYYRLAYSKAVGLHIVRSNDQTVSRVSAQEIALGDFLELYDAFPAAFTEMVDMNVQIGKEEFRRFFGLLESQVQEADQQDS